MAFNFKQLDAVTEADLQSLVGNQVALIVHYHNPSSQRLRVDSATMRVRH
jgi:hypothetical protein